MQYCDCAEHSVAAFIPSTHALKDVLLTLPVGKPGVAKRQLRGSGPVVVFFSGVACNSGELLHTPEALSEWLKAGARDASSISRMSGAFTAVIADGDYVYVVGDYFGMVPIYLYQDQNLLIVSNRLHLIACEMQRTSTPKVPNYAMVTGSLSSDNLFFQQAHSHDTQIQGVSLVAMDHYLRIGPGGDVVRVKRAIRQPSDDGSEDEYGYYDAVLHAAEEMSSNLLALSRCPLFGASILDLSGGIDSRIVFGAALKSGARESVRIRTLSSDTNGDLDIGSGIASLFDYPFFDGDDRIRYSKRSEFGLLLWRSLKAGAHHRIGISNWPTLGLQNPSLHLYGASGEIYRDYWLKSCSTGLSIKTVDALTEQSFFDRIRRPNIDEYKAKLAWQSFSECLAGMPGRSFHERMSSHYKFFRNRFHFGLQQFNLWHGTFDVAILQAPALYSAYSMLSSDDRRRGRVLFDVMDAMAPMLNFLPYTKGFKWPLDIASRSPSFDRFGKQGIRFDHDGVLDRWQRAQETELRRLKKAAVKVDAYTVADDRTMVAAQAADEALALMRRQDGELERLFDSEFLAWRAELQATRPDRALEVESKILAVYDLCFDESLSALDIDGLPHEERYRADFRTHVAVLVESDLWAG
jgi:hypothetical protein